MHRRVVFRSLAGLALVVLVAACAEGGLLSDAGGTSTTDEDLSDFTDVSDSSDFSDFSIPDFSDFSDFSDLTDFSDFSDFSIPDFSDFSDFSDFTDFTDFSDFTDFGGDAVPLDELTPEPIPDDVSSDEADLADDCFDGDMGACDQLYFEAEIDSDVEDWADRCGGRFPESPGLCELAVDTSE